jgi:hypothetical protein
MCHTLCLIALGIITGCGIKQKDDQQKKSDPVDSAGDAVIEVEGGSCVGEARDRYLEEVRLNEQSSAELRAFRDSLSEIKMDNSIVQSGTSLPIVGLRAVLETRNPNQGYYAVTLRAVNLEKSVYYSSSSTDVVAPCKLSSFTKVTPLTAEAQQSLLKCLGDVPVGPGFDQHPSDLGVQLVFENATATIYSADARNCLKN